jgi:hypothetical protein
MVAPYENAISLLYTIPGDDSASAITIISEIGTDISQFTNSKRLCCCADLALGNNDLLVRKNLSELHVLVSTSNLHWYKLPMQP